jgi:hypothetical protein
MNGRRFARLFVATCLLALPSGAQESAPAGARAVPFGVGERLEYDLRFGKMHVGNGSMEVLPMDTVRGRETWHTMFQIKAGTFFYRVNDKFESWFDARSLSSLRFRQDIQEGSYDPKRHYEIFPERREYIENKNDPQPSVEHPVDEAALLYYLRTIPLRVGMDTLINNYFKAKANPIRLRVLRAERIKVPAGEFNSIVVQPTFDSKLFSEGGHAEVWLSDDENHIMLQMKSKLSFGSLNLYLKSFRPSPTTAATNRPRP